MDIKFGIFGCSLATEVDFIDNRPLSLPFRWGLDAGSRLVCLHARAAFSLFLATLFWFATTRSIFFIRSTAVLSIWLTCIVAAWFDTIFILLACATVLSYVFSLLPFGQVSLVLPFFTAFWFWTVLRDMILPVFVSISVLFATFMLPAASF